jgi:RNA recognition motif-containing protein
VYREAWNWPLTTIIVALTALGWFLMGIMVGRRLPRKSANPMDQSRKQRQAASRKPAPSGGNRSTELYLGNLSYDTTENDVRELIGKTAQVSSVRLIENKFNGKSKGYGFVQMADRAGVQAAIKALNGKEYKGRKIVVSEAKSRTRE